MLHEGTSVVAGRGRAVVVAVDAATAAGRAATAAGVAAPPVGVQARLGELTRVVLPLTLAGGASVAGLSLLWRRPLKEAVKAGVAVAVAVAAVPEGLPLVATVAQQAAARRLSRRGAVVHNARVLEALCGSFCSSRAGAANTIMAMRQGLLPGQPGHRVASGPRAEAPTDQPCPRSGSGAAATPPAVEPHRCGRRSRASA